MDWFNHYGLGIILIIMIPNIIYAIKFKHRNIKNHCHKTMLLLEQIGRYACMIFMIFNVPYTWLGFWFDNAIIVYIALNAVLCSLYLMFWLAKSKLSNIVSSIVLSVIPSFIFVISGIMIASIPLIVASLLFAFGHIFISCKNAN